MLYYQNTVIIMGRISEINYSKNHRSAAIHSTSEKEIMTENCIFKKYDNIPVYTENEIFIKALKEDMYVHIVGFLSFIPVKNTKYIRKLGKTTTEEGCEFRIIILNYTQMHCENPCIYGTNAESYSNCIKIDGIIENVADKNIYIKCIIGNETADDFFLKSYTKHKIIKKGLKISIKRCENETFKIGDSVTVSGWICNKSNTSAEIVKRYNSNNKIRIRPYNINYKFQNTDYNHQIKNETIAYTDVLYNARQYLQMLYKKI